VDNHDPGLAAKHRAGACSADPGTPSHTIGSKSPAHKSDHAHLEPSHCYRSDALTATTAPAPEQPFTSPPGEPLNGVVCEAGVPVGHNGFPEIELALLCTRQVGKVQCRDPEEAPCVRVSKALTIGVATPKGTDGIARAGPGCGRSASHAPIIAMWRQR